MSTAINFLLASAIGAAAFGMTPESLIALYEEKHAQVEQLEADVNSQLIKSAKMAWWADGHPGIPSVEDLVDYGYLASDYNERPRVGAPIADGVFEGLQALDGTAAEVAVVDSSSTI